MEVKELLKALTVAEQKIQPDIVIHQKDAVKALQNIVG